MDLERERGITIKAHPVTMLYKAKNGETYELNLIDTPGHVDFSYEVSRSLSACEGALLIIDAAQGVEAQTVANVHLAMKQNLTIIPVINKIDLPHANVAQAKTAIGRHSGHSRRNRHSGQREGRASASRIFWKPSSRAFRRRSRPARRRLQALGFDSYFDTYKGVVTHVRVFNGELKAGMQVKLLHSGKNVEVKEVGSFNPKPYIREKLEVGETGYFTANIKSPKEVKMGDTITDARNPSPALPGFQGNSSDGVQRHLSDQHRGLRASESQPGQIAVERFGVCLFSRKVRWRSASVFVAAFSDCCIWKLSRNVCAANTTWTSSRRIRAWFITSP